VSEFDPEKARQTRRLVWVVLLVSQLVYVGMLVGGSVPLGDARADLPMLPLAFAGLSLGEAAVAHFMWRRATGAGRPLHAAPVEPTAAFTSYLIAWVLDEAIGLYGFVMGFLGFPAEVWGWFSAAALALLVLHRPSGDDAAT
jgi:F0F1-type ATP synthase membrane subunit c/vacuolar-type H+-ATPase subunit K